MCTSTFPERRPWISWRLILPWLVKRLGVRSDSEREKEFEKQLAERAARAAKRRLKAIEAVEDLPEELSEQMLRRAFQIGVRISPEMGEEERREAISSGCGGCSGCGGSRASC